jgi:hypothetical protein
LADEAGGLAEAREVAEEALALRKILDPGAQEIWKTYDLLAGIADREAALAADSGQKAELQRQARNHRRLAREAKRNFAGTRHELRQHRPLIVATVRAVQDQQARRELESVFADLERKGGTSLVAAIRRLLDGERDVDLLCEDLEADGSMIIEAILAGLADPSTLADLLPQDAKDV